jgi:hypothetical protein
MAQSNTITTPGVTGGGEYRYLVFEWQETKREIGRTTIKWNLYGQGGGGKIASTFKITLNNDIICSKNN